MTQLMVNEAGVFGAMVRVNARRRDANATVREKGVLSACYSAENEKAWEAADRLLGCLDEGKCWADRVKAMRECEKVVGGGL